MKKPLWEFTGAQTGLASHTEYYEHQRPGGQFCIKTVDDYLGSTVEIYPSREYFERYLQGENSGKKIKTVSRT